MAACLEWVIVTTSQRPVAQRKGEGYVRPGNNSQVQTATDDWRCGSDMVDGGRATNHVCCKEDNQQQFDPEFFNCSGLPLPTSVFYHGHLYVRFS